MDTIKIGTKVGRLIVEEPTERRKSGYIIWKCRCGCGGEVFLDTRCLQRGTVRDCGCSASRTGPERGSRKGQRCRREARPVLKDYVGKRFGRLTVSEYAGKWAGMHRWRCRCDCGRETVVGQTLLQSGKTKSCGCLQAATYRQNLQLVDGTSVTILKAVKQGRLIKSNTSGYNGVYFNKKKNLWVAQITFRKKTKYLGSFPRLEDAIEARRRGE